MPSSPRSPSPLFRVWTKFRPVCMQGSDLGLWLWLWLDQGRQNRLAVSIYLEQQNLECYFLSVAQWVLRYLIRSLKQNTKRRTHLLTTLKIACTLQQLLFLRSRCRVEDTQSACLVRRVIGYNVKYAPTAMREAGGVEWSVVWVWQKWRKWRERSASAGSNSSTCTLVSNQCDGSSVADGAIACSRRCHSFWRCRV